jgi:hypothetical protein
LRVSDIALDRNDALPELGNGICESIAPSAGDRHLRSRCQQEAGHF